MSYYDEELESIANSIDRDINHFSKLQKYSTIILFMGTLVYLYLTIQFGNQPYPPISIYFSILILMGISYLVFINATNRKKRIFNDMREKIFFYLFYSWKYHNDEKSKKYLKECIDNLSSYLWDYEELAYTEDVYSAFDTLLDTLTYHIYPKLGVRGDFEKQNELIKQSSAWNEFKSLSVDLYQNVPITSINTRTSTLKGLFERDETMQFDDENKLIKTVKTFTNWNIGMYKNNLSYRFLFYLLLTGVIDFILISQNMVISDAIIPATILIPIMAPYYLAPKSK